MHLSFPGKTKGAKTTREGEGHTNLHVIRPHLVDDFFLTTPTFCGKNNETTFYEMSINDLLSNINASESRSSAAGGFQRTQTVGWVTCLFFPPHPTRSGTVSRKFQNSAALLVLLDHHMSSSFLPRGELVPNSRRQNKPWTPPTTLSRLSPHPATSSLGLGIHPSSSPPPPPFPRAPSWARVFG